MIKKKFIEIKSSCLKKKKSRGSKKKMASSFVHIHILENFKIVRKMMLKKIKGEIDT